MLPPALVHNFYRDPDFDTIQLHVGYEPDVTTNARAPPIYASTSFVFDNSKHGADLFGVRTKGNIYSRLSNPTVNVLERRMAALEGGTAAVATASGHAAEFMAIAAIANAGDNLVSSSYLYGGTYKLFKVFLKKFNITIKFVESEDPADFAAAIDENTKGIYVESISNPKNAVSRIPELAKVAHDNGIPLLVDNTFGMGGYLIRPFELGADIITHSVTKWVGGHGVAIGGMVIDGGTFDWAKSGKFPDFTEPMKHYQGTRFAEEYGDTAFAAKCRLDVLRDIGPCMDPIPAFLILMGIETLSLRAQRHCDNALALAEWLGTHPKVSWVSYLGLESHSSHQEALRLLRPNAFGGMVNFGIKIKGDGLKVGSAVVDSMKLASNLANVGDAKTLVIHPSSTTHQQLTTEEQLASGVTPDLIRVSVGIESIEDIIADFDNALKVVP